MEIAEPAQDSLLTAAQTIVSTLVVALSGVASSVYIGWLLTHGQSPMTPVLAYAAAANLHLASVATMFALRARDWRRLGSVRPTLIVGSVVIGAFAAAGFHEMHPASPAVGMLYGGFVAAIGPLLVGLVLVPSRCMMSTMREGSADCRGITAPSA
jgi:hypothetical protein